MKAYLTNLFFRYHTPSLFKACLLFYPKLYLRIDPKTIKWTNIDRYACEKIHGMTFPHGIVLETMESEIDLSLMALKRYFNNNPSCFHKIQNRLIDMKTIDTTTQIFFHTNFKLPLSLGDTPIFSANVFGRVIELAQEFKKSVSGRDLDWWDTLDCCLITQDLFVSSYMARQHRMDAVTLAWEAQIRADLLAGDDMRLWDSPEIIGCHEFFPNNSLHSLLGGATPRERHFTMEFVEVFIPDFDAIPIDVLIDYISKDKPKPISIYVSELIEKYGYMIKKEDIVNEVIGKFFAVTKVLWPTIPTVVIGLIGNAPSPLLVNPIGLWVWSKGVLTKHKIDKDYAWILAVKELRDLVRKQ